MKYSYGDSKYYLTYKNNEKTLIYDILADII